MGGERVGIKTRLGGGCYRLCLLMCCAVALSGTGCWLLAPPPSPSLGLRSLEEPEADFPLTPAEEPDDPFFDEPDDPPMEQPVEEPIRPVVAPIQEPIEWSADLTDDGVIDEGDIDAFSDLFGSSEDGEDFNPAADFDGDGEVTLVDFQIFLELIAQSEEE